MGKFSLKKGDGDADSSRLALFGSRSKSKSPAPTPASHNPYAQPTIPPDPYTQAKMNAGILPRPGADGPGSSGSPNAIGSYGGSAQPGEPRGGYNDNRYGAPQGGYAPNGYGRPPQPGQYGLQDNKYGPPGAGASGANPYASISQTSGTSRYGPAGYGGLGRTNSDETLTTDAGRDALFGDARARAEQRQQAGGPSYGDNPGQSGGGQGSYGAYGDRQLTAEEEEEEDITATKQDIKFMKQQDVSSTRNALQMAAAAEESGRSTLARLGDQGERIHNTEKNLDLAANHNLSAADKYNELKRLNRSMFIPSTGNPFTGKQRRARRDEEIYERHQKEREQREATREAAYKDKARLNKNFQGIDERPNANSTKNLAERAKYQFEADDEDEQLEDEIDTNLEALTGAAGRLNHLAKATASELEAQNRHLERIGDKSDQVDTGLHMNTERLKRFH